MNHCFQGSKLSSTSLYEEFDWFYSLKFSVKVDMELNVPNLPSHLASPVLTESLMGSYICSMGNKGVQGVACGICEQMLRAVLNGEV